MTLPCVSESMMICTLSLLVKSGNQCSMVHVKKYGCVGTYILYLLLDYSSMTALAVILYIGTMENLCTDRGSTAGAVEREKLLDIVRDYYDLRPCSCRDE